ncbi:hypothetical protein CIW69_00060 [Enterobacter cloacae]|nr:hypothetical protein CIW69_00060 [Enterobacter cloacae]
MKVIIFLALLILCFVIIPDTWINNIIMQHIQISGDGEEAMNTYEFTAILIKFGISTVVSLVVLLLPKLFKR